MHKKLIMACLAIAAFAAFVVAPAASASPTLTSNGVSVPVGTSITGTSTGEAIFTGPFDVRCHAHLTGIVTQNNGTSIKGEIAAHNGVFTGTGTNNDCTSALGSVKVTVTSKLCMETLVGTHNIKVTGCGAAPVTFDLTVTGIASPCRYSTPSVTATFTTNADATVTLVEQIAKEEPEFASVFCPNEGKLDMDFDLYTTDGTTLTVS